MIGFFDLRRSGLYAFLGFVIGIILIIAVYDYQSTETSVEFLQFARESKTQTLMLLLLLAVPTIGGIIIGSIRSKNKALKSALKEAIVERDRLSKLQSAAQNIKGMLDQESGLFVENWDELVTEKDKLREEAEVSSTLLKVALEIGGLTEADNVLQMLADSLPRALFADQCLSLVWEPDENAYVCRQDKETKLDAKSSKAVQKIIKDHQPLVIDKIEESRLLTKKIIDKYSIKSAILIPCVKRKEVAAIAVVIYSKAAHEFADRDIQIASGIVSSATIVLENADLYDEVIANRNDLKRLLTRLAQSQEDERRRFARDLHDGVIQNLSGIIFSLSFLEEALDDKNGSAAKEIKQTAKIVEDTIADLRQVIYDLRPTILDTLGLGPTLKKHLERFSAVNEIESTYLADLPDRLPDPIETSLFRLAQEALNNIKKHAQATEISLCLSKIRGQVIMEVKDNGDGFDPQNQKRRVSQDSGFGLSGMRERVQSINGEIEIDSKVGHGTVVKVTVPLMVKGA